MLTIFHNDFVMLDGQSHYQVLKKKKKQVKLWYRWNVTHKEKLIKEQYLTYIAMPNRLLLPLHPWVKQFRFKKAALYFLLQVLKVSIAVSPCTNFVKTSNYFNSIAIVNCFLSWKRKVSMNLCHRCILMKGALSFFKCPSGYMTFLKRQVFKCASYTQLPSSDSLSWKVWNMPTVKKRKNWNVNQKWEEVV